MSSKDLVKRTNRNGEADSRLKWIVKGNESEEGDHDAGKEGEHRAGEESELAQEAFAQCWTDDVFNDHAMQ